MVCVRQTVLIRKYTAKVTKKNYDTRDVVILTLQPDDSASYPKWKPGQYADIFSCEGKRIGSYSIISQPDESVLQFAVKCTGSGKLLEACNVGDCLLLSEPMGTFCIRPKPAEFRTILAFASGIGITPIYPILYALLEAEPRTRVFLFFGNRQPSQIPLHSDLETLEARYPDRFRIHYFYSQDASVGPLYHGRLDGKKFNLIVNQILALDDTDEESTLFDATDYVLICGPGDMIRNIASEAYRSGIPKEQILFEHFEERHSTIFPSLVETPMVKDISVEYSYRGEKRHLVQKENSVTLLEEIRGAGFPVPYSCKSGICGLCMAKLEIGSVVRMEDEYLTDGEVEKGYILACRSFASSDKVELNFDV